MSKRKKTTVTGLIPQETIKSKILPIRGKKVMLDKDLAILYGITTGNLNKAVSRNLSRFPEDFMFRLTREELNSLLFQFGIAKRGGTRNLPRVFTEHGILMLSSVLNSERAIQVNITIMRIFVKLKQLMPAHKNLLYKMKEMEKKIKQNTEDISTIFDAG